MKFTHVIQRFECDDPKLKYFFIIDRFPAIKEELQGIVGWNRTVLLTTTDYNDIIHLDPDDIPF